MESLIDHEHGPTVLIACLVAILAAHLLWKIGERVFENQSKKSEQLEQKIDRFTNILSSYMSDIIHLTDKMSDIEKRLSDLIAVENKIRKLNIAVKLIAGENWEEIKNSISEE